MATSTASILDTFVLLNHNCRLENEEGEFRMAKGMTMILQEGDESVVG